MKNYKSFSTAYKLTWNLVSKEKKQLFFAYIFLSVVIALLEIIAIVSLINIMSFVTSSDLPILSKLQIYFDLNIYSNEKIFYFISYFLIFVILITFFFKIILQYINAKISFGTNYEINKIIFDNLTYFNFLNYKKININKVISNQSKIYDINLAITSNLSALSSLIIGSFIFASLLTLDVKIVVSSCFIFFFTYLILARISKKKLLENSQGISESINLKFNILSLLMGSIRSVILDKMQDHYIKYHSKLDNVILQSRISNAMIAAFPSIFFSNLIILAFITLVLIVMLSGKSFITNLPVYAALAFGVQKLIPSINQIYIAFTRNSAGFYNIMEVLKFIEMLKSKTKIKRSKINSNNKKVIEIKNKISLQKIKFKYINNKLLLNNINLQFKKGDRILIQGKSGVGKTTLIEIISGLLKPLSGKLKVDDQIINENSLHLYQKNISIVPQEIFLAEDSFLNNIVLANPQEKINLEKVKLCSKIAEIDNFINSTKKKYNTIVSYNGKNLSAGQKQRIGIARGLYKNSSILIFDESTSALDEKTETKIFANIKKFLKDQIVIFVSHNKKNISHFNKILVLDNGKLKKKNISLS
jgi:ABC-type multidrug transport system fused ATPase/permease subunit